MLEVRLLVATHSRLLYVVTDGEQLEWSEVDTAGRFYGLTHMLDGSICVGVNYLCVPVKQFDENTYHVATTRLQILDPETLEWVHDRPLPVSVHLGDVHQILYAHSGLYVCDCARNALMFWQDDGNLYPSAGDVDYKYRELLFEGTTLDSSHPNSVFVVDDDKVAVVLHHRHTKPSEVALVYNPPDDPMAVRSVTPLGHLGVHNLYIRDNIALYNASDGGKVVTYDLDRQEVVTEVTVGGHVKGLAMTEHHFITASSQHAAQRDRFAASADLLIFAKDDPTRYRRAELGPVGNVNEILVLE